MTVVHEAGQHQAREMGDEKTGKMAHDQAQDQAQDQAHPMVPHAALSDHAVRRATMTGIDYVRAQMAGTMALSPMALNMGLQLIDVQDGLVRMQITPGPHLYNHATVHGGAMAAIMDSVMSSAINTQLPRGARSVTVELKTRFVAAPGQDCGTLTAIGKTLAIGPRRAFAQAQLEGADGKVYCKASGEFHLRGNTG